MAATFNTICYLRTICCIHPCQHITELLVHTATRFGTSQNVCSMLAPCSTQFSIFQCIIGMLQNVCSDCIHYRMFVIYTHCVQYCAECLLYTAIKPHIECKTVCCWQPCIQIHYRMFTVYFVAIIFIIEQNICCIQSGIQYRMFAVCSHHDTTFNTLEIVCCLQPLYANTLQNVCSVQPQYSIQCRIVAAYIKGIQYVTECLLYTGTMTPYSIHYKIYAVFSCSTIFNR